MESIKVGARTVQVDVVKIRAGSEDAALRAMARDGVDNVAFKVGADTFVASGRDLDLKGLATWQTVERAGSTGHVLKLDREAFGAARVLRWSGISAAIGAITFPAAMAFFSAFVSEVPSLLSLGVGAGVGALVTGAVGLGWMAFKGWWNGRQAKHDKLAPFVAAA